MQVRQKGNNRYVVEWSSREQETELTCILQSDKQGMFYSQLDPLPT